MVREKVYIDRDNVIRIKFKKGGQPLDLITITRIELQIEELSIIVTDNVSTSYPLKWTLVPEEIGVLEMQLGSTSNLVEGLYVAQLFIYDASTPNGVYWTSLELEVIE